MTETSFKDASRQGNRPVESITCHLDGRIFELTVASSTLDLSDIDSRRSIMASTMVSQPVLFTTQTQYPLPSQKFMIPTSWKRYQLSQLVNKALSLDKPVPFDFLVRGEILRSTLNEWCSENGVGEVRSYSLISRSRTDRAWLGRDT